MAILGKLIEMKDLLLLILGLLAGVTTLLGSRGIRALLAENLLLKQQLLVMRRSRQRAPNLRTADRLLFGFCSWFLSPRRLLRTAIILKPSTLLRFHRWLKEGKYRFLYSSSPKRKPGPKGPAPELILTICEFKQRNPRFGCPRIRPAVQLFSFHKLLIFKPGDAPKGPRHAVVKTHPIPKEAPMCIMGSRYVPALYDAKEKRQGAPLLQSGGKPAGSWRPSGATPCAIPWRDKRQSTGSLAKDHRDL